MAGGKSGESKKLIKKLKRLYTKRTKWLLLLLVVSFYIYFAI